MGPDITAMVRANRVEDAPLKYVKEMKKTTRSTYHQITDLLYNTILLRYNDNNIVTIASTESGVQPLRKVKRWCNNKRVDVVQPHCYQLYKLYVLTKMLGNIGLL
ncbi:hypothetical protein HHI36_004297 [Cryptolaemus montrouzieri]|uniref:PiggyBac transposable element-derived protein domain-containing protein n=1 Tax=Cryptolaemus montrouzieri TaxID=559131 RepID=A0ABD2NQR7_9CUCU